jgi:hypothetical protein
MEGIFTLGFMDNLKILFVGLIIYAIIYSMLKGTDIFPSEKISSLVALLAAIIVSFTGIVTYIVAYAINWFVILFFILFLLMVLLMFLGVKMSDITSSALENKKIIAVAFIVLFSIILVKGFFGVNNAFDPNTLNNENYDPYIVDTSTPGQITEAGTPTTEFFKNINISVDSETTQAAIFLLIVGVFVFLIGRD